MYLSMYYVGIPRTTLTNALETLAGPNHRPWQPRERATSLSVGSFSTSTLMLPACLSPPFPGSQTGKPQSTELWGGGCGASLQSPSPHPDLGQMWTSVSN